MGRLLQIWRHLVPTAYKEWSGAKHDESEHDSAGHQAAVRESRGRSQDDRSSQSAKRQARARSQEQGRESSLEHQSGRAEQQAHIESRRDPYPIPKPYSAVSASQEVEVEWELYPSKTAAQIFYVADF